MIISLPFARSLSDAKKGRVLLQNLSPEYERQDKSGNWRGVPQSVAILDRYQSATL
jgi:hypothetical protein